MAGKPIHGLALTPEYRAWQQMRLRCTDPQHAAWKDYGGRGITVCQQWLDSPQQFLDDVGPRPSPAHELDRYPNNDGNYEPGNVRWALRTENCRNRRSNLMIEHAGETLPLVAWAERAGMRADTLKHRLATGWDMAAALTTPVKDKAPNGQAKPALKRACLECGDPTGGTWCKPCANRRNGARAIVAANYSEQRQLRQVA